MFTRHLDVHRIFKLPSGFLVPNVDLPPICHSKFRPGPPSEQAQTASNFLRQVIDNSRLVNLEDLCVKPGKLAW